jgi:hypothetical protein
MKWFTKWLRYRRQVLLLLSLIIAALSLLAVAIPGGLVAAESSTEELSLAQLQPERPGRKAKLEVSATDSPVGQAVALMARTERPESEAFVMVIRREGEGVDSGEAAGLEAACRSKSVCTADVVSQKRSSRKYAAAIYRCDGQGDVCVLDEDATEADKVLVTWR